MEGEARNYIKAESKRDTQDKIFELLASRFGTGANRMHVRQAFASRYQLEKKDWLQNLDALEGLRCRPFPNEPTTTTRYEILQRFIEGVRDTALRRELSIIYASETIVTAPTTVETLRFTTRQLQGNPPKQSQTFDPRYAMRSKPHPFVPLQPNEMALPQAVLPPPPPSNAQANPVAASPTVCIPLGACFKCQQPTVLPEPEAVKTTAEEFVECIAEKCFEVRFCVNCGMVDHVASQCVENHVSNNFPYTRWSEVEAVDVAAHTVPYAR